MDRKELIDYISGTLKMTISIDHPFVTPVNDDIRKFVGKVIKRIVKSLHKIVSDEADRLGLFTAEIAGDSKVFKIFVADEYDFIKERLMQREVLIYLLNKKPVDSMMKFIRGLEPLGLGDLSVNEYIEGMLNIHCDRNVRDDVDQRYEDGQFSSSRQEEVLFVGSADGNIFDFGEDSDLE